jgi:hypothetical protein
MANLVLPPLARSLHRLPKWALGVGIAVAVFALMTLSFAVGRATMDHGGAAKPQPAHAAVQPAPPATRGGVNCHQHEQC